AIHYSEKSLHEFFQEGSDYNQIQALFALAYVYEHTGEANKILEVLAEIEPLLEVNSDDLIESKYYKLLAEGYYQRGDYEDALRYAEKSLKLLRNSEQNLSVNHLDDLLFRIHYLLGNRETADSIY